jgi:hypothetical protein
MRAMRLPGVRGCRGTILNGKDCAAPQVPPNVGRKQQRTLGWVPCAGRRAQRDPTRLAPSSCRDWLRRRAATDQPRRGIVQVSNCPFQLAAHVVNRLGEHVRALGERGDFLRECLDLRDEGLQYIDQAVSGVLIWRSGGLGWLFSGHRRPMVKEPGERVNAVSAFRGWTLYHQWSTLPATWHRERPERANPFAVGGNAARWPLSSSVRICTSASSTVTLRH